VKLVIFIHAGRAGYGITDGTIVRPASDGFCETYPDLRAVLAADALDALDSAVGPPIALGQVELLPPVPNPAKIVCVGLNYRKPYPVGGVAPPDPENIILFGKERQAIVGHGSALEIPPKGPDQSFDYEAEIAIVIGRQGLCIPPDQAMDHVAGFTAFNDGSVRDWQKHSIHAGKNFEKSGSCGPWMVTADEIVAPDDMTLIARLNGDVVQHAKASEMIYTMAEQISYISQVTTLLPGDIIATGSPDGTGGSRSPKRYLRKGDLLEISVSGVGTLANTVGRRRSIRISRALSCNPSGSMSRLTNYDGQHWPSSRVAGAAMMRQSRSPNTSLTRTAAAWNPTASSGCCNTRGSMRTAS